MAIKTSTTWSADHWEHDHLTRAELEREGGTASWAELAIGDEKVLLDASQLRELSTAAARIADEIEASK